MARYLVVANQTAASSDLVDRLREMVEDEDSIVLLVPATPSQDLLTWQEGGRERAQRVAIEATGMLRGAGLHPEDAVIGDADPLRAITAEIESDRRKYDAVIISTLPLGLSRWLRHNLPREVEHRFGIPVTHIVVHHERGGVMAPGVTSGDAVDGAPWALRELGEWRGRPLVTSDGHRLSHVSEILYDPTTERPVWIAATESKADMSPTLIPASASRVEGDHLRVGYSWEFLSHEPPVLVGAGFSSSTEEEALYEYFELPFEPDLDLRVLRQGEEYPDSLSYPSKN